VPGSFFILLVCSRCYRSTWLRLEGIESTAPISSTLLETSPAPSTARSAKSPAQVDESAPCLHQLYQSKNNLNRR